MTAKRDDFKSTLRFRAEFIKLKQELLSYSMIKQIAEDMQIKRHYHKDERKQTRKMISITSQLWHVHSCSGRENTENPGWNSGTNTDWTVKVLVRLKLMTAAVSPEATHKFSCHPAQKTLSAFLVIPSTGLSYSCISRSSELFFSITNSN